ncbi:hypothetical protein [Serratia quinivorans]|uniref:hypothetical protein n=1 Tax=Serratia quinivorans TaxID=137545 RepID=UPI003F947027
MEYELSALASLKRNVKFWFDSCGYNKEQVIRQIEKWGNFAYSPGEQEKAKEVILSGLKNDRE